MSAGGLFALGGGRRSLGLGGEAGLPSLSRQSSVRKLLPETPSGLAPSPKNSSMSGIRLRLVRFLGLIKRSELAGLPYLRVISGLTVGAGPLPPQACAFAISAFILSTNSCAPKGLTMLSSALTLWASALFKGSKVPASSITGVFFRSGSFL